jgi:glycosyltransferase involved in cell wall biosynthesis
VKVAIVANLPSHFKTKLFETISEHYDAHFFFFSDGGESWIEKKNKLEIGDYQGEWLRGFKIGNTRITMGLFSKLFQGNYDVIIAGIVGRFALPATFVTAKILRRPLIICTNLWFHPKTFFHRMSFPVLKFIYRHSDAIVVYGYHVRDYLVSLGIDESKIFYSWNVIDNDMFNKPVPNKVLEDLRVACNVRDQKVILYVGRLSEEKGLKYLLEAYRAIPPKLNASLLIIGEGNQKRELSQYVRENRLGQVHFLDYVPNNQLPYYYALADVFVLPSVTTRTFKEPWGVVINEAMNQACPVIATDAVGAAVGGLVEEGKNGFVVPEKNSEALRDVITNMLSNRVRHLQMKEYAKRSIQDWNHLKSFHGFREAIDYALRSKRKNIRKPG